MSLQQVHLRVNDAATGQPTPVRLRITDAAGTYYAPNGRLTEFATGVNQDVGGNVMIGAKKWAYIDGTCEILLRPGTLHIEIAKGPEYKPIDEEITLLAGKMSLRFTIERWSDVRTEGWYSGDTRVHFMSPDAALLEGQAEDVAVVNLLAGVTTHVDACNNRQISIPNILAVSGQAFARQAARCGVAVNTHNVHPQLGSLGLLHCHRIVYPLTFDDQAWTLDDWCGQCHRKNGLVVWTCPSARWAEFGYGEPLADLILGHIDAFESMFLEDSQFDPLVDYYRLLNAGMMVSLVGGSGKDSNGQTLGAMRTYAYVPADQELTYSNWIDAVRHGRTYVSNGPVLHWTINSEVPANGHGMGAGQPTVRIRAEAKCSTAFEHLELIWNGAAIEKANGMPTFAATLEVDFAPKESGWLAVRCRGDAQVPGGAAPQRLFAHSSAVAICVDDARPKPEPGAVRHLLAELEKLLQWAQTRNAGRLTHVVEQARTQLAKKLS